MGIEQRFEISNSQIVNPREFLSRPPWEGWGELDVGRLAAQPSRKLLRRLPKVVDEFGDPYEVNMVRRKGVWFLYKTALFYNKVEFMPPDSEFFIHSHPAQEHAPIDVVKPFLPSTSDFVDCHEHVRNFIVSQEGITQYWPMVINGEKIGRNRANEIISEMGIGDTNDEYMRFLIGMNARFELYSWGQITSERLAELIKT